MEQTPPAGERYDPMVVIQETLEALFLPPAGSEPGTRSLRDGKMSPEQVDIPTMVEALVGGAVIFLEANSLQRDGQTLSVGEYWAFAQTDEFGDFCDQLDELLGFVEPSEVDQVRTSAHEASFSFRIASSVAGFDRQKPTTVEPVSFDDSKLHRYDPAYADILTALICAAKDRMAGQ